MKKTSIRVFSMLLALVMLFGMAAAAETKKITFELNGPDGLKLDGILTAGYDVDGCEQYAFESSMLGKWLLQSDGVDLVFGGDQLGGNYVISTQDLVTALENVSNMLASQDKSEAELALTEYFDSAAFQADIEAASQILAYEVNRIASIAQEMGLIAIYENGDLEINVDRNNLLSMVAAYLNAVASDEELISSVFALEIFKALGVDVEEIKGDVLFEIKDTVRRIERTLQAESKNMDGGLKLYVSAQTGEVTGEFFMSERVGGVVLEEMKATFAYFGETMKLNVYEKQDDVELTYSVAADNNEVYYEMNYRENDDTVRLAYEITGNGMVAELVSNGDFMSGEGKLVIDANGIDGKWNFSEDDEVVSGSIKYAAADETFVCKINVSDSYESLKASIEYEDEELYAELTKYEGRTMVADIVISGSSTYRIKANGIIDNTKYALNATLRMKDSGCEIDGELAIAEGLIEFNFTEDKANKTETFVVDVTGANPSDKIVAEAKRVVTDTAVRVNESVIVSVGGDSVSVNTFTEMNTATGMLTGEFEMNENGSTFSGNYSFGAEGFEVNVSDGQMNYRLYAEVDASEYAASLKAGLTGEEIANPGQIMDAILIMFNAAFENGLTFDMNINTVMGFFASAIFDGKSIMLDITQNGVTVSFEGKLVETETASYLEFTGIVDGQPFEARIGLKMEDEATFCLFAEMIANGAKVFDVEAHLVQAADGYVIEIFGDSIKLSEGEKIVIRLGMAMQSEETVLLYGEVTGEAPEHKAGAYLPITVIEGENSTIIKSALSVAQGEEIMAIGDVLLGYEVLAENLKHVSGERLTADMLTEMIVEILNSMTAAN